MRVAGTIVLVSAAQHAAVRAAMRNDCLEFTTAKEE
jgi:hypothetical protein